MRRTIGWMVVVVAFWMSPVKAEEGSPPQPDARLVEAQADFDAAEKLKVSGDYSGALTRAERARALREAVLGSDHLDVASCLNLLGYLHRQQGHLDEAESLLTHALSLREQSPGERPLEVAQSLSDLADVHLAQAKYDQAERLFKRALDLRKAAPGEKHSLVASSLNDLAALYAAQGKYKDAKSLLEEALVLRKNAPGESHLDVAHTLNDLAAIYWLLGQYKKAGEYFESSLSLYEKALGRNHADVAQLYSNLATLHVNQGHYVKAEHRIERALEIYEAVGPNHDPARVADTLDNLAGIYAEQGLYDRAVPPLERARDLRKKALGETHPLFAVSLNNLAHIHVAQGKYNQAKKLFQDALKIYEASFEPSHHSTIMLLRNNLASVYMFQGLYGRAEPLLQQVLALRKKVLDKQHPQVADSLKLLADLYFFKGLYDRAEPFYQDALAIRENVLGPLHHDLVGPLLGLAQIRLVQQRLDDALPLFDRAFSISEQRLRHEALGFSESRLSSFLRSLRADEETLYALLRAHPQDARVRRLALRAALLLKGRSAEETAQISRTINQSLDAEGRDTFERLRILRTRLMELSHRGPGALSDKEYQQQLTALADEGDNLERNLARRSAPLRFLASLISLEEDVVGRVASSLPKDGALVEFIAYADRPLIHTPGTPPTPAPGQLRYLALVLFPDASTRAVDLGPAADIDAASSGLRDALAKKSASYQGAAQQLHELVFKPLRPLLGSTRRLLLSPDGQLGLVPFDALHDGHAFLLDSFDFTYLTSGRELVSRPQDIAPASSVIVFADPDFLAPTAKPPSPKSGSEPKRSLNCWRSGSLDGDPPRLPGTRQEAQAIQRLLPQSELFLGPEATKERLLQLPTPGIFHIATHGFFLGDSPSRATSGQTPVDFADSCGPATTAPLLKSGLLLASTQAPISGTLPPPVESRAVSALELAGLNFWGTQLVVLSACDTGRGAVQLGQGIYGLRRALVVAGAETVVMSLWKVDDDSTRLLMEDYYRNLLAGQGRASALRQAMRSLRETHPHPYHWAPFIALGSDAPLRGIAPP